MPRPIVRGVDRSRAPRSRRSVIYPSPPLPRPRRREKPEESAQTFSRPAGHLPTYLYRNRARIFASGEMTIEINLSVGNRVNTRIYREPGQRRSRCFFTSFGSFGKFGKFLAGAASVSEFWREIAGNRWVFATLGGLWIGLFLL